MLLQNMTAIQCKTVTRYFLRFAASYARAEAMRISLKYHFKKEQAWTVCYIAADRATPFYVHQKYLLEIDTSSAGERDRNNSLAFAIL